VPAGPPELERRRAAHPGGLGGCGGARQLGLDTVFPAGSEELLGVETGYVGNDLGHETVGDPARVLRALVLVEPVDDVLIRTVARRRRGLRSAFMTDGRGDTKAREPTRRRLPRFELLSGMPLRRDCRP
jgi:hypothetical protein